jgi:uncharacterized protein
MKRTKTLKEAAIFFALTLGASYFVFWGPLALFKIPTISFVSDIKGPTWAIVLYMLGGFVPSLVALLLTGIWEGRQGLRQLGRRVIQVKIGWRWYLAVLLIVLIATVGQLIIGRLMGNVFDLSLFVQQLGSFLPLIIIGPLSEELGWRGYAQDRLQTAFSPVLSAVILGTLWALWHLPLFFIVGTSQHELGLPFLPFWLTLIAMAIAFAWLHNHTGGSIWTAIFFHWIYTYASQVVSSGFPQTPLNSWLLCIPYLVMAGLVMVVWKSAFRAAMREAHVR